MTTTPLMRTHKETCLFFFSRDFYPELLISVSMALFMRYLLDRYAKRTEFAHHESVLNVDRMSGFSVDRLADFYETATVFTETLKKVP